MHHSASQEQVHAVAQCKTQQPQLAVGKGASRAGSRHAAQAEHVVRHPVLQEGLPQQGVLLMQHLSGAMLRQPTRNGLQACLFSISFWLPGHSA